MKVLLRYLLLALPLLLFVNSASAVYDPRVGRWLSRDPIGEDGGFNLYSYCGNDPVNRHDPLGLSDLWFEQQRAIGRLNRAIDYGDSTEIAAAQAGMTISPWDSRLSPPSKAQKILMDLAGSLIGPSKADLALSPAQPLGSGLRHDVSLYGWSLYNSTVEMLSLGRDPARLITGGQSFSAQVLGDEYRRRFTYGERSAADFNLAIASFAAPFAVSRVGELAEGAFGGVRGLSLSAEGLAGEPVFHLNNFGEIGAINPQGSLIRRLASKGGTITEDAVRFHHPWPQYLGGEVQQLLEPLPKSMHDAFHRGLDKILPRRKGTAYYEALSPAARARALEDLGTYVKRFDAKYETKLYEAMVREGFPY